MNHEEHLIASLHKLFGVVKNKNGMMRFCNQTNNRKPSPQALQSKTMNTLSRSKDFRKNNLDDTEDEDSIKMKHLRQKAQKAMRNPRCGYDFVDRLKDRGDFLERLTKPNENGKDVSKLLRNSLEQDYNARLDKLYCLQCKKVQSFDEFFEKKRLCSQCNVRFGPLVVCNLSKFERRMQSHQERRETRLKEIEAEMYRELTGQPTIMNTVAKQINCGKTDKCSGLISDSPRHSARLSTYSTPRPGSQRTCTGSYEYSDVSNVKKGENSLDRNLTTGTLRQLSSMVRADPSRTRPQMQCLRSTTSGCKELDRPQMRTTSMRNNFSSRSNDSARDESNRKLSAYADHDNVMMEKFSKLLDC